VFHEGSNFELDDRSKAQIKDLWLLKTFGKFKVNRFSLRTPQTAQSLVNPLAFCSIEFHITK
jgi:hypothetical protein